jgi:hypothetical protein
MDTKSDVAADEQRGVDDETLPERHGKSNLSENEHRFRQNGIHLPRFALASRLRVVNLFDTCRTGQRGRQ